MRLIGQKAGRRGSDDGLAIGGHASASWRRSRNAEPDSGVEVAAVGGMVAIRDVKHPPDLVLLVTSETWLAFAAKDKAGRVGP